MNAMRDEHWQRIYREKGEQQTSWFRPHLDESLRRIDALPIGAGDAAIDVGAGRSTLVDDLLARGWRDLTVLDLAPAALAAARARLGADAAQVRWIAGDVAQADLPAAHYALWHDRAVFHFLTDAAERARYVEQAARAVRQGGYAVIATFAPDGPERCSGLPVTRYDADALGAEFAPAFVRIDAGRDLHRTPWDAEQAFTYVVLRRV